MTEYLLENVWQKRTDSLRDEIVHFWLENGALPAREQAEARAGQVVYVVRDDQNRIVGVNTAYPQFNERLGHTFYYYRVFVAETHRQAHLADRLTSGAREYFNQKFIDGENREVIGMFAVVESEILKKFATQAVRPTGFIYIGKDNHSNHLRVLYFDGALI